MARQKGSANFAGTLEVLAGGPLDARTRVPTKADLTASGQFPYPFVGMETYVVAENKKYRLTGDDPTVLANWEEVGSGGTGLPSGGTQGQVLTKQSATDGDANWDDIPHDNTKANSSSIAPVETSTTSEHAYEIGDHLMLAGQRYVVTSDIAVGDTLDVSTNIQAISIEDETGLSQADFAEIITPLPGKFVGGFNFSTKEQVVGTWIDGKPIYSKTVSGVTGTTSTQGTSVDVFVPIGASVDVGVRAIGLIYDRAKGVFYQLHNSPTFASGIGFCSVHLKTSYESGDPNCIMVRNTTPIFSGCTFYVTAFYTKTTDPTP